MSYIVTSQLEERSLNLNLNWKKRRGAVNAELKSSLAFIRLGPSTWDEIIKIRSCSSKSTPQPGREIETKMDLGTSRTYSDFFLSIWTHQASTSPYTSGHERAQAFLALETRCDPPWHTAIWTDRPWEPVRGRADSREHHEPRSQAVKTSAQQVCEMISGASEAPARLGSSLPKYC